VVVALGLFALSGAMPTAAQEVVDEVPNSLAEVWIETPIGLVSVILEAPPSLPTKVEVDLGSIRLNGSGREEVDTEIISMELTGTSTLLGPITLRLRDPAEHPNKPSEGKMRETENNTPGVVDIRPFTSTGAADSFFDVFFKIEIPNAPPGLTLLHNHDAKHMVATSPITHWPPAPGETYFNPDLIPLFDESESFSGVYLGATYWTPNPGPVGGTTELLVGGPDSPGTPAEGSGSSSPPYAAIAGAVAAAVALAAGGWYARRRWMR
jgi:hypothetical protein